jgi:hypothetical protein
MRYPIICEAISKGIAMTVYYEQKQRTIEPYCYGVSKEGNELLRLWQVSPPPIIGADQWKLFRLDKASLLSISGTKFGAQRNGYNRNDPVMYRIYCER